MRRVDDRTPDVQRHRVVSSRRRPQRGRFGSVPWADVPNVAAAANIVYGIEGSSKNNRVRHLPMTDDLWETLALRTPNGPYVFGDDDGPATHSKAGGGLSRACRHVGLRHIGWHALRHSFASQLAMLGVPLTAIQALLGQTRPILRPPDMTFSVNSGRST
jgi:integrase